MPTRNINLTDRFDRFIKKGVASGRFGNASEVVREGLRLLEERERAEQAKLRWLRGEIQKGIDDIERGDYTEFHSMDNLDAFIDQVGREASAEHAARRKRG